MLPSFQAGIRTANAKKNNNSSIFGTIFSSSEAFLLYSKVNGTLIRKVKKKKKPKWKLRHSKLQLYHILTSLHFPKTNLIMTKSQSRPLWKLGNFQRRNGSCDRPCVYSDMLAPSSGYIWENYYNSSRLAF